MHLARLVRREGLGRNEDSQQRNENCTLDGSQVASLKRSKRSKESKKPRNLASRFFRTRGAMARARARRCSSRLAVAHYQKNTVALAIALSG